MQNSGDQGAPPTQSGPPTRGQDGWILQSLNDISRDLGAVGSKLDAIDASIKDVKLDIKENSSAIGALKGKFSWAAGGACVVLALCGWLFAIVFGEYTRLASGAVAQAIDSALVGQQGDLPAKDEEASGNPKTPRP